MGKASRKKEQQVKGISSAPIPASTYQSFLVRPLPAVLIVLLLSFMVHFNVLSNGFGWDDEEIIQNLHPPEHWWQIGSFLLPHSTVKENAPYFRPVVELSYRLDYALWGKRPFGFHLSVLLAHLLNTVLVFLLAQTLVRDKKPPYTFLPILVASLFAVHPVHAEAVAWIAGRNDVFCTTFILSSILLYIRFRQTGKQWAFGLSMLFFFFALLTKEMAVGLALLFPLYDYLSEPLNSSQTRKHFRFRFLIPLVTLGLYFYMRMTRLAAPYGPAGSTDFISLETIKRIIGAAGLYLKLMIFPYPLNPFITALPISASFLLFSTLAWALLIGGLILSLIRREALLGMGLAPSGIVTLAPAVWIGVMGVPATLAAERYLYAPSVGFLMVLVWLILRGLEQIQVRTEWPRQRVWRAAGLMGMILLTVWGWESWSRNGVWKNTLIFWETAVNTLHGRSPRNALAHYNLGLAYKDVGSLDKAIEQYQMALELRPDYADAHNNLGNVYSKQGRLEEAIREYQITLKLQPTLAQAHYNIGNAHIDQGHLEEAIQEYQIALKLQPDFAETYYNLAKAYVDQERLEEGIQSYQNAINIKPDYVEAYNSLGIAYARLGRLKEAERQFQTTLRLQQSHANAHSNLGFVYARNGQLDEAILEFEASLKLNPTNAEVHINLGTALKQQGKIKEAREEFKRALQIKPDFLPARQALDSLPK